MNALTQQRLKLFPDSAQLVSQADGACLTIAGCSLTALAEEFGTPLYVYDALSLENATTAYQTSLAQAYPGECGLTYAGKAYLSLALARWLTDHNMYLDCSSQGELAIARQAGVPRAALVAHGVNKSLADMQAAEKDAGVVVIDNLAELARWLERPGALRMQFWLRWRPGQKAATHTYTQTGHTESKFGLSSAELRQALSRAQAGGLDVTGFHFHIGSQLRDLHPLQAASAGAFELLAELRQATGWTPQVFCPGGGLGVAYHEQELPQPSIAAYARTLAESVTSGCQAFGLPLPRLQLEPGRSLIARAGVAVYRVGAVKVSGERRWLLLDGGLADNPRPALYGARYSALPARGLERAYTGAVTLGGPYCESGDILIADLDLPEIQPGELLAIPVSGAYQLSMSANYNGALRPAVVWCAHGDAQLIQRREQTADLYRRDLPLAR